MISGCKSLLHELFGRQGWSRTLPSCGGRRLPGIAVASRMCRAGTHSSIGCTFVLRCHTARSPCSTFRSSLLRSHANLTQSSGRSSTRSRCQSSRYPEVDLWNVCLERNRRCICWNGGIANGSQHSSSWKRLFRFVVFRLMRTRIIWRLIGIIEVVIFIIRIRVLCSRLF